MVRMAEYAYERTGSRNLCIAGGTALNGLANARVLQRSRFENVWIPPGCSDTGLSLGLALWGYFQDVAGPERSRVSVSMTSPYTGRSYPREQITRMLDRYGIAYRAVEPEAVAPHIASGKVIGWFEGGSEFGPRALGHRSILADPRDPGMKDTLEPAGQVPGALSSLRAQRARRARARLVRPRRRQPVHAAWSWTCAKTSAHASPR